MDIFSAHNDTFRPTSVSTERCLASYLRIKHDVSCVLPVTVMVLSVAPL